jgi:hypothetical protein
MLPIRQELLPFTQRLIRAAKLAIYAGRSTRNMDVVVIYVNNSPMYAGGLGAAFLFNRISRAD